MPDSRSTLDPRPRRHRILAHLTLAAALGGSAFLCFGAVSGLAADKSIEATGASLATYAWTPSTATVSTGGTVEFKNSTGVAHAVEFTAPPSAPSCPGVPTVGSGSWSGTCTFSQPGTYNFHCTVHPTQMMGTITVTGGPTAPLVTTEPASAVTGTGATLNGKVNPSGQATTYHFEYGQTEGYGEATTPASAGSGNANVSESAAISSLTPATTYHFRLVAENETGTSHGADRTFRTAGPPTATTEAATGVGGVKATLAGTVNPSGIETKYFFKYGTSPSYGQTTAEKSAGSGSADVAKTEPLTGLQPETLYHFRIVAKNSAGEAEGVDKTFTTLGKPLATTGLASGIGATAATVEGTVNPQGQATSYFFEFGPTEAYGGKTAEKAVGEGVGNLNVSAPLTELLPDTTYHFALVAKNASGTTHGADHTFLTGSTPPPPPPEEEKKVTPPPPPGETEVPAPDTKITTKPPAKTKDRTPTIKFKATIAGASFRCSVDNKPFKACRSPFTTPSLKPGKHKIRVQAIAGVGDPTPATVSFKVVAAKKK